MNSSPEADPVPRLEIGACATLACLLEVAAPKVGNVHRGADFPDMTLQDFLVSAAVVGDVFQQAPGRGVGATVLDAVRATRRWAATNTNLGAILLLAPLAAAGPELTPAGVRNVLSRLTAQDAADVYAAIQLASPGGLGRTDELDVAGPPPGDLRTAMRLAAERDRVARQYAEDFAEVFQQVAPQLEEEAASHPLPQAIVRVQVRQLASAADSLIARKCGPAVAEQAAALARAAWRVREDPEQWRGALADLDFWLRSDGNRRNPGTTADLIAAGLYVLLIQGRLRAPLK